MVDFYVMLTFCANALEIRKSEVMALTLSGAEPSCDPSVNQSNAMDALLNEESLLFTCMPFGIKAAVK